MKKLLNSNNFINLIKTNTCFKGVESCIDSILTNKTCYFQYGRSYETGFINHHRHLIYATLKTPLKNTEAKLLKYRCYKNFSLDIFKDDLT